MYISLRKHIYDAFRQCATFTCTVVTEEATYTQHQLRVSLFQRVSHNTSLLARWLHPPFFGQYHFSLFAFALLLTCRFVVSNVRVVTSMTTRREIPNGLLNHILLTGIPFAK